MTDDSNDNLIQRIGEVGIIEGGTHHGKYILIEEDESRDGFHIWILEQWPGHLPNDGWDGWADDIDGVRNWLSDPQFSVRWTGQQPGSEPPHI